MSSELLRLWGSNIRAVRGARGLSMEAFAKDVGVSAATVSRWEAGRMCPRDEHKIEIATVLDADVRTLFPLVRSQVA